MKQLRAVFAKALDRSLTRFGRLDVDAFYPTLKENQKKPVREMSKDLIRTMKDNMEVRSRSLCETDARRIVELIRRPLPSQREFEDIVDHTNVCAQLNALDKIMIQQAVSSDGTRRVPVGGGPLKMIRMKLLEMKKRKRDALKKKLDALQEEVGAMQKTATEISMQDKENSEHLSRAFSELSSVPSL